MGVTAPPAVQAKLLDLAECDRALQRAASQLRALPETLHIPTLEAAVEEIKGRKHDAMVEKENIQAELTRAESDVQLVEARIQKDDERLTQTSSAKDAQGLDHELETLRKRRSDLEDIELAIMERLDQADKALVGVQAELATAEGALTEARAELVTQSLSSNRRLQGSPLVARPSWAVFPTMSTHSMSASGNATVWEHPTCAGEYRAPAEWR